MKSEKEVWFERFVHATKLRFFIIVNCDEAMTLEDVDTFLDLYRFRNEIQKYFDSYDVEASARACYALYKDKGLSLI